MWVVDTFCALVLLMLFLSMLSSPPPGLSK
jgi:hypothetical protein